MTWTTATDEAVDADEEHGEEEADGPQGRQWHLRQSFRVQIENQAWSCAGGLVVVVMGWKVLGVSLGVWGLGCYLESWVVGD